MKSSKIKNNQGYELFIPFQKIGYLLNGGDVYESSKG